MAKAHGEREFSPDGGTPHRGAPGGQRDPETRLHPLADVFDEELLVCREAFRIKHRRVLLEPRVVLGKPVDTDDHRSPRAGGLEDLGQPRDMPPTVTGEDDGLGGARRDVHRDLAATVVLERLGDELSSYARHWRGLLASSSYAASAAITCSPSATVNGRS
jgi:hypothetical protein